VRGGGFERETITYAVTEEKKRKKGDQEKRKGDMTLHVWRTKGGGKEIHGGGGGRPTSGERLNL